MPKETSHRGDELKSLGWTKLDVARYIELWEYRQRWGAMNLEREDRLFLRKAENALPKILSGRSAARKLLKDKSYYGWLRFQCGAMMTAEIEMRLKAGERGAWPVLLESELRILDYYEPVLGLPDTLKARALCPIREALATQAAAFGKVRIYDFQAALNELKAKENNRWKHLRDVDANDHTYPVLNIDNVEVFRHKAHHEIHSLIRDTFPSLAGTDKPAMSDF
ncbi:hypothetical protein [Synechococcus sp. M16CYN]|uniref:hypothetical protein n=1 Tax=Synechococcus sp. M16CYN TaxID=3103139 RepID=UPI00324CDA7D